MKSHLKILLVEDRESDAELIMYEVSKSFPDTQFKLIRNKKEFDPILKSFDFDIVLSDYSLPDMTGLVVLKSIRTIAPETPFILITGFLGEEKAIEVLKAGVDDYILKDNLGDLPASLIKTFNLFQERRKKVKARQDLEKRENFYRALIEHNSDILLVVDRNDRITYISPIVKRYLGYNANQLLNRNAKDFIHPDDLEMRVRTMLSLKGQTYKSKKFRVRWLNKNGTSVWMESIMSDHRGVPGINGFVCNLRSIDEFVRIENELKQKSELLNAVMESLREGVVVTNHEGGIIHFNKSAIKLLGKKHLNMSLDELKGMDTLIWSNSKVPVKFNELPTYRVAQGESIKNEEIYVENDSEGGVYLNVNGRPLIGNGHTEHRGVVSFSDFTDVVHYRNKLEETLSDLEKMIDERTRDLQTAHLKLKETHKHLQHSISYAKRIQEAITFNENDVSKLFKDSLFISIPKDVVSGDFVWLNVGQVTHFAVADCTGHGVPGAMLSMIANELLDRIVGDRQIKRPEIILEELNTLMKRVLNSSNSVQEMHDGMDIALCSIDADHKIITYSGANNPAVYFNGDNMELILPNRLSIGGFMPGRVKEFDRRVINYQESDRLYFFTDGFQDQFGGKDDRKYSRKRLLELLQKIQNSPMKKQKEILLEQFATWKKDKSQIDDVTIVGIEF